MKKFSIIGKNLTGDRKISTGGLHDSPEKAERSKKYECYNYVSDAMWHSFMNDNHFPPPANTCEVGQRLASAIHILENTLRYNGRSAVSVAEHSVRVAQCAQQIAAERKTHGRLSTKDCDFYLLGLLHDLSEAWTGDVGWSMKQMIGRNFFKEIERRINEVLYPAFGLDAGLVWNLEVQGIVNAADNMAGEEEWQAGMTRFKSVLNWKFSQEVLKYWEWANADPKVMKAHDTVLKSGGYVDT